MTNTNKHNCKDEKDSTTLWHFEWYNILIWWNVKWGRGSFNSNNENRKHFNILEPQYPSFKMVNGAFSYWLQYRPCHDEEWAPRITMVVFSYIDYKINTVRKTRDSIAFVLQQAFVATSETNISNPESRWILLCLRLHIHNRKRVNSQSLTCQMLLIGTR